MAKFIIFSIIPFLFLYVETLEAASFSITNQCAFPVWPGLLSGAGTAQLPTTGFALQPGESNVIPIPASWSGRVWGRTLCSSDPAGKFSCLTGDCGSGTLQCNGAGAAPPTSLAEFTLNGADGMDFYDVSLVDGYNLPMLITPQGDLAGNCTATGCAADLNAACPNELQQQQGPNGGCVACKSACEAFGNAMYCCSGAYATPETCNPTPYSQYFKSACPQAYSYAYDDRTSTFTCASASYVITFCPGLPNSRKTGGDNSVSMASRDTRRSSSSSTSLVNCSIFAAVWLLWRQLAPH